MKTRLLSTLGMLVVALAIGYEGCAELPSIDANVCGNGVLEAKEDCEYVAGKATCYPAGSGLDLHSERKECRFACSRTTTATGLKCPAGMTCGIDEVCRRTTSTFEKGVKYSIDTPANALASGQFDGDGRDDLVATGAADAVGLRRIRVFYSNGGKRGWYFDVSRE